ncbi:IS630 family transposase [Thermoleptolyngbya sp. PKUAC-SCTB121]|uniref:IS630 family transposase n=1 Tax=Thermoleptolyngbya sp. PKUAC-SCTB121 TaxID=2811482 RepID=UPI0019658984|nr:IS630 family transposase [Thermoleptolyngbya sp. PKUAC-SCTB121]
MRPYSLDLRQKIIDVYIEGNTSQRQIAQQFRVAYSFVRKLIKQYRETGEIAPKRRTEQTPTKLSNEQLEILKTIAESNHDATLAELCDLLEQRVGVRIGVSTMFRMLEKLNLTLKKKTLYPDKKETERVQIERVKFWQLVRGFLAQDLIFIDESGVNLALARLRARAPKGKRAHGKRPSKRGKRVSILGAISLKKVITYSNLIGSVDGLTFEAFISQRLVPKLWKGACVIMDNCSIHLGEEVRRLIEDAGAKLMFLPPYSPDFSPIENCFSKIKSILRSLGARSYLDLDKAIEESFSQVSLNDLQNWFSHCCYYASPE